MKSRISVFLARVRRSMGIARLTRSLNGDLDQSMEKHDRDGTVEVSRYRFSDG